MDEFLSFEEHVKQWKKDRHEKDMYEIRKEMYYRLSTEGDRNNRLAKSREDRQHEIEKEIKNAEKRARAMELYNILFQYCTPPSIPINIIYCADEKDELLLNSMCNGNYANNIAFTTDIENLLFKAKPKKLDYNVVQVPIMIVLGDCVSVDVDYLIEKLKKKDIIMTKADFVILPLGIQKALLTLYLNEGLDVDYVPTIVVCQNPVALNSPYGNINEYPIYTINEVIKNLEEKGIVYCNNDSNVIREYLHKSIQKECFIYERRKLVQGWIEAQSNRELPPKYAEKIKSELNRIYQEIISNSSSLHRRLVHKEK